MAKTRSRLLDYAAYLAVRIADCTLQILPPSWSLAIVHALADVAYLVDRRHRHVAFDNLRQAFPGRYTEDQLRRLTRDVYRHFAMMLLEMTLLPRRYASRRWRQELVALTPDILKKVAASGRPILVVTAHYGNWELAAFIVRAYGIRAHLVARPLDNPFLDDSVRRFRESCGHKVISKHGDLTKMMSVLESGGAVCTLADQDAGHRGTFVDFFGRPASTHKAIALLAMRSNALMVVVGTQNVGGLFHYAVRVTDVIDPLDYAQDAQAILAITQRMTAGVEQLVRYDPRQYLWLHRRWKSQPPRDRERKAA